MDRGEAREFAKAAVVSGVNGLSLVLLAVVAAEYASAELPWQSGAAFAASVERHVLDWFRSPQLRDEAILAYVGALVVVFGPLIQLLRTDLNRAAVSGERDKQEADDEIDRTELTGEAPADPPTGDDTESAGVDGPVAAGTGREPTGTEPAGKRPVQSVRGVDPTYAERLTEHGIETVDALAAADATDLAGRIDVSESRVARWVENAKGLAEREEATSTDSVTAGTTGNESEQTPDARAEDDERTETDAGTGDSAGRDSS